LQCKQIGNKIHTRPAKKKRKTKRTKESVATESRAKKRHWNKFSAFNLPQYFCRNSSLLTCWTCSQYFLAASNKMRFRKFIEIVEKWGKLSQSAERLKAKTLANSRRCLKLILWIQESIIPQGCPTTKSELSKFFGVVKHLCSSFPIKYLYDFIHTYI